MTRAPTLAELTPLLEALHELAELQKELALLVDLSLLVEPLQAAAREGRVEDLPGADDDYHQHGLPRFLADARGFTLALNGPVQRLPAVWARVQAATAGLTEAGAWCAA